MSLLAQILLTEWPSIEADMIGRVQSPVIGSLSLREGLVLAEARVITQMPFLRGDAWLVRDRRDLDEWFRGDPFTTSAKTEAAQVMKDFTKSKQSNSRVAWAVEVTKAVTRFELAEAYEYERSRVK